MIQSDRDTTGKSHFQQLMDTTYRVPIRLAILAMFIGLIAVQGLPNKAGLIGGAVLLVAGGLAALYVGVAALLAERAHRQVKGH